MKLITVSVGKPRKIRDGLKSTQTAIFKEPVAGRVRVGRMNLDGDAQADLRVHGGADKAVYAYPLEHYEAWARELGRTLEPAQFGENFTVEGMLEDSIRVGDVFRFGSALCLVSQPRLPCFKLALRMGMKEFPKMFTRSGRSGFYLRVLEEGEAGAGDPIERVREDPAGMPVAEVFRLMTVDRGDRAGMERALKIEGLAACVRASFNERLSLPLP